MKLAELQEGYFILKRQARARRDKNVTEYVKERTGQIYRMYRTGGILVRDSSVLIVLSPEEKIISLGYLW